MRGFNNSKVTRLNPLGIGEGFERHPSLYLTRLLRCLNPLGIGEGFEPQLLDFKLTQQWVLIP